MGKLLQEINAAAREGGVMGVWSLVVKASERDKLREQAKARAKKYGISVKENGNLSPPKGYPDKASEYGDPVNYKYPCDAEHAQPAVNYYNQSGQRSDGGYSTAEWTIIGRRIARLVNRHLDAKWKYEDGKLVKKEGD